MDNFKKVNPRLIKDLVNGTHPLAGNPSIPDTLDEKNFLVKLFGERFKTTYNEGKRAIKKDDVNLMDVMKHSAGLVQVINSIEMEHKSELEDLALSIVIKEFDVDLDYVEFDVKLINDFINIDHVRKQPTSNVKLKLDTKEDVSRVKNEVHKRRMINAMIQGASNKFNSLFHMYRDEFNKMDRRLVDGYQQVMSSAELAYFMFDDRAKMAGGMCSVTVPTTPDGKFKISVEAITFPLLIHELIKGVLEVISLQGFPEDTDETKYIMEKADYYDAEIWDTILGVGIWEKIVDQMDIEGYTLKHHIFHELVTLPVDEFHDTMQEILSDTTKANTIIKNIVENIKSDIKLDDALDNMYDNDI